MKAVLWSDYLCPWCYLGRDRTALLVELGVTVTHLPYELHPEIPTEGVRLASDDPRRGRYRAMYDAIAEECERAGRPFTRPRHVPNTRRVLETAEWVRRNDPEAFPNLDDALFRAHFVDGEDLGDPSLIDTLVERSGADHEAARAAVDAGEMRAGMDAARERALDAGVSGTPAWLVDGRLLIPGVQSEDWIRRVIRRLAEQRS